MSIYTEKFADKDYYDDDDYYRPQPLIVNGKKAEKIRNDSTKHYPNKDEARELRKIMASTDSLKKKRYAKIRSTGRCSQMHRIVVRKPKELKP